MVIAIPAFTDGHTSETVFFSSGLLICGNSPEDAGH
jgi:hypothetical protein